MSFVAVDFMSTLRAFLAEYPALNPGETLEIGYMSITANPRENRKFPEGEAIAFVGSAVVRKTEDILGRIELDEQSNIVLILRRHTDDANTRRDIGDFLFNYTRWINYENSRRGMSDEHPKLPRFSMTQDEVIRADGGMQIGTIEVDGGVVDEFQIQIHIEYQTVYLPIY
jgi:hypothetical protein